MTTRPDVFKNVKIGEIFYCQGHKCRKRSTRTADVFVSHCPDAWYYFCQNAFVTVG